MPCCGLAVSLFNLLGLSKVCWDDGGFPPSLHTFLYCRRTPRCEVSNTSTAGVALIRGIILYTEFANEQIIDCCKECGAIIPKYPHDKQCEFKGKRVCMPCKDNLEQWMQELIRWEKQKTN